MLFPFDVDAGGDTGLPGEEYFAGTGARYRHASVYREDAQFHRTIKEAQGGPVRIRRYESDRLTHFRYSQNIHFKNSYQHVIVTCVLNNS